MKRTVGKLIEELNKFDPDLEVIVFDHRMNQHNADSDGTVEGIYSDIEVSSETLYKFDDGVINETKPFEVVALSIVNDVDYEQDGSRIE